MLRRVALVRADVSEELSTSIIRVTRISELGTKLAGTSNRRNRANTDGLLRSVFRLLVTTKIPSCHPDDGGVKFLRNVGFYKSHTA
jgi:hypothetical protein